MAALGMMKTNPARRRRSVASSATSSAIAIVVEVTETSLRLLLYRPVPADEITALLAERNRHTAGLPELLGLAPENT